MALIVAGVLGSPTLLLVATGVVLLLGVPTAIGARLACAVVGLACLVAAVAGAGGTLLDVAVGVLTLGFALAPSPRPQRAAAADLGAVAGRAHLAYDASSPSQVFVSTRT
jgi:hypothetical protein